MKLTKALEKLIDINGTIISNVGKRYTVDMLQPKKLGGTAFVFNRSGMTKSEREGRWSV